MAIFITPVDLSNLPASSLTGTIPNSVLGASTAYVGTTALALNRASANQALTGISSVALPGSTSGSITLLPAAIAGANTLTFPAVTGVVVTTGDTGSVTNTMLAGSIADSKLGTISSAGKIANSATTATSANTASAIVSRDASGNFSAGTVTTTVTQATAGVRLLDADASNYVALLCPSVVGTNVSYTLPGVDGSSGQVLSTNGSGALSWATATSGATIVDGGNFANGSSVVSSSSTIDGGAF